MNRPARPNAPRLKEIMMNSPYNMDLAMELDSIESVYQTISIFDHDEIVGEPDVRAANEDPYEDYENLYLVPS